MKGSKGAAAEINDLRSSSDLVNVTLSSHLDPTVKDTLDRSTLPEKVSRFAIPEFTQEETNKWVSFYQAEKVLHSDLPFEVLTKRLWTSTNGNPSQLVKETLSSPFL